MITDSVNSIKAYLYDRTSSPLLGAMIISWAIWNYKFVMLIFCDMSYSEKLIMINSLYDTNYELHFVGMIFPLATTIFYIFIFPYPSLFVYKFYLNRQSELNKSKQEKENNTLLSVEDSINLRMEMENIKNKIASQIQSKDILIEDKDKIIKSQSESISEKDEEIISNSRELDDLNNKINTLNEEVSTLQDEVKYQISEVEKYKKAKETYEEANKKYYELVKKQNEIENVIENKEKLVLDHVLNFLYEREGINTSQSVLIMEICEAINSTDKRIASYYLDKFVADGYVLLSHSNGSYKISDKSLSIMVKRKIKDQIL
ncbi:hypothetical protein ACTAJO_000724 [Vibrio fluvialis]